MKEFYLMSPFIVGRGREKGDFIFGGDTDIHFGLNRELTEARDFRFS